MKRSQQSVPSAETGATSGDYHRQQSIKWENKGGRNATTNAGMRGSGIAPKPSGGAAISGNDRPGMSAQAGLARVTAAGKGNPQGRLPLQSPPANITGTKMPYGGHGAPPAQRGGPQALRAGGRNQGWPNGAMYTDGAKKGSSGKDSGALS